MPACLVAGRVSYAKAAAVDFFHAGLERLREGVGSGPA